MEIKINIVKKHLYIFAILAAVIIGALLTYAAYDTTKASHATLYTDTIEPKNTAAGSGININSNLGVGKTPTEKLDVNGNIKASGTICDSSGNCVGNAPQVSQTVICGDGTATRTCPSGWTRSGCSGGNPYKDKGDVVVPSGDAGCTYYGNGDSNIRVCAHCIQII